MYLVNEIPVFAIMNAEGKVCLKYIDKRMSLK